ncbi:MAG TPA: fructosamine kinase family protein [Burkholderiales bacterium]|nr:fructosamine kinase family protein [Burkholderiales bacterium]
MPWGDISESISSATGAIFRIEQNSAAGGGGINAAHRIDGCGRSYFVKVNSADKADMFAAEAEGLREIAASATVRVPQPVCLGANRAASWLVMEHIALGRARSGGMRELGRQLAALHRVTGGAFGWRRDNTIGSTPQINAQSGNWMAFWRERRLGFQLRRATANGYRGRLQRDGEALLEKLPAFFAAHRPQPALVHGDLWSGNTGFDEAGNPVIFDPAVYYGDRETDLAMTELFGGFSADFHAAYREAYPLDTGYELRKTLYNLYHVLNHLNLFGGGYLGRAERMIGQLLAAA